MFLSMFFPFLKEEAQQRGEHTHTGSKETAHRAVTAENTLVVLCHIMFIN